MTAPVFVDTNVLVYRHDASNPAKQVRAGRLAACSRTRTFRSAQFPGVAGVVRHAHAQAATGHRRAGSAGNRARSDSVATVGNRPRNHRASMATAGKLPPLVVGRTHRRRRAIRRLPRAADRGSPARSGLWSSSGGRPVRATESDAGGNSGDAGVMIGRLAPPPPRTGSRTSSSRRPARCCRSGRGIGKTTGRFALMGEY